MGLKGMRVEEAAKKILAGLGQLQVDLGKLEESFEKVGKQMQFAQANFEDAGKRLAVFAQHLAGLSGLPADTEEAAASLPPAPKT